MKTDKECLKEALKEWQRAPIYFNDNEEEINKVKELGVTDTNIDEDLRFDFKYSQIVYEKVNGLWIKEDHLNVYDDNGDNIVCGSTQAIRDEIKVTPYKESEEMMYNIAKNSFIKEMKKLKKIKKYLLSRDMHRPDFIEYLKDEIKDIEEKLKALKES